LRNIGWQPGIVVCALEFDRGKYGDFVLKCSAKINGSGCDRNVNMSFWDEAMRWRCVILREIVLI
jgi:hypothetical protein